MKKGDTLTANWTSALWDLTEGEKLIALSGEKFYNGEFHIQTSKGWLPSVFFYDMKKTPKYSIEAVRNGEVVAKFEEMLPAMNSEEHKIWRLVKGIAQINKMIGGLKGEKIVYKIDGKEVNF
jgi:hypothetical protein